MAVKMFFVNSSVEKNRYCHAKFNELGIFGYIMIVNTVMSPASKKI